MWVRSRVYENRALLISYTGLMIVVVFLFTTVFSLYIPETHGFFNIGESGVYIAALTGGPIVGAIAGGFGSMLSDLVLGYAIYAPATLVIKAVEGFLVGYLSLIFRKLASSRRGYVTCLVIALIAVGAFYVLGSSFYVGSAEVTIQLASSVTYKLNITRFIWIALAIIVAIAVLIIAWKLKSYIGYTVACIIGGLEMILGYYLYEQFILGVLAVAEIPFNTMQMLIGMIIAISIVSIIEGMKIS